MKASIVLIAALAASTAAAAAPLRVGVLPDADSLPLLVAADEALFADEGVEVALLPFKTAFERDAALQAGAIDGAVSDLLAVALAKQGGFDIRATSLTDGRYGIVTAPGSGLASLAALAGKSVGISSNTIIHYAAETMLVRAGLKPSEFRVLAVPNIQLRMELLLAGRLDAACLPEPLLSVAASKGAALLAKSDDSGLGAGVIAFSAAAIDGRLADIAGLYRAYWRAARRIDAAPDSYRGFLVDKAGFPAPIRDSYAFVVYRKPRLPSAADLAAVLDWMKARGLIKSDPGIGSDGTGLVDAAGLVDARVLAEASKGW